MSAKKGLPSSEQACAEKALVVSFSSWVNVEAGCALRFCLVIVNAVLDVEPAVPERAILLVGRSFLESRRISVLRTAMIWRFVLQSPLGFDSSSKSLRRCLNLITVC